MYHATEQFAEFNKANVAQATKLAALAIENAEKLVKPQPERRQGRARARASKARPPPTSVKDVQDLMALRAKYAEIGRRRPRSPTRRSLYEIVVAKRKRSTRRSPKKRGRRTRRASRRGSRRPASRPRPARSRRQRVQVDVRRDDRRVRPVPEGDEAGREPGRCVVRAAAANASKAAPKGRRAA